MDIKNGSYAIYHNNWYKADEKNDGTGKIVLISFNPKDCELGFREAKYTSNRFSKHVKTPELDIAYNVNRFAEYEGYNFNVSVTSDNGMYDLRHQNSIIEKRQGFVEVDRAVYKKRVKLHNITKLWEELEPIWGFEGETEIRILKE